MVEAPILIYSNYDKRFLFYTDASYQGLDFILAQKDDQEREYPVHYRRRKLRSNERNYTITDLECLSIV